MEHVLVSFLSIRRGPRPRNQEQADRGIVSAADWRRGRIRWAMRIIHVATLLFLLLIYHYAFQNSLGGDYGMAAALSVMLAAFLGVFTAGYFWLTRSWSTSS